MHLFAHSTSTTNNLPIEVSRDAPSFLEPRNPLVPFWKEIVSTTDGIRHFASSHHHSKFQCKNIISAWNSYPTWTLMLEDFWKKKRPHQTNIRGYQYVAILYSYCRIIVVAGFWIPCRSVSSLVDFWEAFEVVEAQLPPLISETFGINFLWWAGKKIWNTGE